MEAQICQQSLHRYDRFKADLLVEFIAVHHGFQHIYVTSGHVPSSLRRQSQRLDPVKSASFKHDHVARPLIEGDYFELMAETPVNVGEPEAFVLEEVEIVGFLRLGPKLLNVFLDPDAVPEGTGGTVVQICGADS